MAQRKLTEKDTLGFLGDAAQYRIVKSLIEDKKLFITVHPYLNENAFTEDGLRKIVKILNDKYDEKGIVPSYKDLEYTLKDIAKSDDELTQYKVAFDKLKSEKMVDGQATATEIGIEWFKQQEAQRILKNGTNTMKDGFSVEKMEHIIEGLQNIEKNVTDDGVFVADLMDSIFDEDLTEKVPTGIEQLDEKMKGGLTKGALGLLIAGTGVGKSTLASIMCCNASLQGYNVLHIFFEDSVKDMGRKYYAHLTNEYCDRFSSKSDRAMMKEKIWSSHPYAKDALTKRVKLRKMDNGTTSVENIKTLVRHLIEAEGWKPDMIFIDYLSCLSASSNQALQMDKEHIVFERCMRKLEAFASETDIAVWVAQQTNRDAFKSNESRSGIDKVQGSFRVTQPCSAILYLDKRGLEMNRANLNLEKCRGGELCNWENIYMNNGTCQIDLSEAITPADLPWSDNDSKMYVEEEAPSHYEFVNNSEF